MPAKSKAVNKMSFGKLMGIAGGFFVFVILVAVVIVNVAAKQKASSNVVTTKHQQRYEKADQLEEEMKFLQEQKDAAARADEEERTKAAHKELEKQNRIANQRLERALNNVDALSQRVAALENTQRHSRVEIVKPQRKPRERAINKMARNAERLPASAGFRVRATVGDRAWIISGDSEDSVSIGDNLPVPQKPLVVTAVDYESGIVITNSTR